MIHTSAKARSADPSPPSGDSSKSVSIHVGQTSVTTVSTVATTANNLLSLPRFYG